LSIFTIEAQIEFKDKFEILEKSFSDSNFFALYNELKPYVADSLIRVLNFLEAILENEKIMVIHGFLALIYHENDFMELSRQHAIEARKYFPDTEIWDQIINNSIWDEFMQEREMKFNS